MKLIDKKKKAFMLLSTYFIILTTPKKKVNDSDNKIIFNEEYQFEEVIPYASYKDKTIYITNELLIEQIKDNNSSNIYVTDNRKLDNPTISIYDSYKINNIKDMNNILNILLTYEQEYPSKWNRTLNSMRKE